MTSDSNSGQLIGKRHIQCFMLFICLILAYAFRVNMSVGIVEITDMNSTNTDFAHYYWDTGTQGLILSSFFWGYVISQVPAGQLGAMYGPKYLLVAAMGMNCVFCILTPLMASIGGAGAVMGCRVIQGLSQGFFYPSIHNLLAKWIPLAERGRLGTFVYAGAQLGTAIALPTSGFLAGSSIGWPSIFYVFGAAGFLWAVFWFFIGSNSPADHPSISPKEKEYIETSLGTDPKAKRVSTPWRAMFISLPMWSLIIAHCGQNWGFWTLFTEMPTYMKKVLNFDMTQNGIMSALPYFVMWVLSFAFSAISDFLTNRNYISVVAGRKIGNSIGSWIPALALIALGYVSSDNSGLAVTLLTLAVGINSATFVGFQVNHIDLAPKHAGTMMGITNGASNLLSILAPILVGYIVTDDGKDVKQWRIVFFISAGIYFICNLVFVLFGRADIQPWNDIEEYNNTIAESARYSGTIVINEQVQKDTQAEHSRTKYKFNLNNKFIGQESN